MSRRRRRWTFQRGRTIRRSRASCPPASQSRRPDPWDDSAYRTFDGSTIKVARSVYRRSGDESSLAVVPSMGLQAFRISPGHPCSGRFHFSPRSWHPCHGRRKIVRVCEVRLAAPSNSCGTNGRTIQAFAIIMIASTRTVPTAASGFSKEIHPSLEALFNVPLSGNDRRPHREIAAVARRDSLFQLPAA